MLSLFAKQILAIFMRKNFKARPQVTVERLGRIKWLLTKGHNLKKQPTMKQIEEAERYADKMMGVMDWQAAYERKLDQLLNKTTTGEKERECDSIIFSDGGGDCVHRLH